MTATKTKEAPKVERGPRPSEIRKESVEVPEWDMTVEVRAMSINDQVALTMTDDGHFVSRMLTATCFDPDSGEKLFKAEDAEWLDAEPSGSPAEVLVGLASDLSGLNGDPAEAVEQGKGDS